MPSNQPAPGSAESWTGLTRDISAVCAALGLGFEVFDRHGRVGRITYPDGRRSHFKGTAFDINALGAAQIARDKDYCARALRRAGLNAPDSRVLLAPHLAARLRTHGSLGPATGDAYSDVGAAVAAIGLPAVVKPIDGTEGTGVSLVTSLGDAASRIDGLFVRHDRVLLQPWLPGHDLRVVVLDGETLFACERRRPSVVGDGRRTIAALIERLDGDRRRAGHRTASMADDPSVRYHLAQCGRDLDSVPRAGERADLLPTANLSKGGEMVERTDRLHPDYRRLCADAAAAIGLRFAGVDLLCATVERFDPGCTILELNAAPGLSHAGRVIGRDRLRGLYRRLITAMGTPSP